MTNIYLVIYQCPGDDESDHGYDEVEAAFSTEELAKQYIEDKHSWFFTIKEVEMIA